MDSFGASRGRRKKRLGDLLIEGGSMTNSFNRHYRHKRKVMSDRNLVLC